MLSKIFSKEFFLVLFLILALVYAPVANAGGVVNPIVKAIVPVLKVVAVVAAAVVIGAVTAGAGLALAPALFTTLVGTAIVGAAMVGTGLLVADCLVGSPIDPGLVCNGGNGGGGGEGVGGTGEGASPLSVGSFTSASPTCTSLTLSGIDPQGHKYAILRDGQIVAQLLASQTSFTDTGLKPHTNYNYKIRIPYPEESGFQTADSAEIKGYTTCLPQCNFAVVSSSVAQFGSTDLQWRCVYNDPTADSGECRITDDLRTVSKTVDSNQGLLTVSPSDDNQYILSCKNIDGKIFIPQSVTVLKPGLKEVKP